MKYGNPWLIDKLNGQLVDFFDTPYGFNMFLSIGLFHRLIPLNF